MELYVALFVCVVSAFASEEVHHIRSHNGRNVHIHLHEVGECAEEAHHYHHHGDNEEEGGEHSAHHDKVDEDSADPEGGGGIHVHIHEAGENCSSHGKHDRHRGSPGDRHRGHHGDDHGGYHGSCEGGQHGDRQRGHHGDRHGGSGARACSMCARELAHRDEGFPYAHPVDHPGHHGPHIHGEESPKHAHSEDYVYARCDMVPDSGLPKKQRLKIKGTVHMRQLIYGGLTEIRVELSGFQPHKDDTDQLHGMHVHEFGDLSDGCRSTGSHFNPFGVDHGGPTDDIRHPGDYGNIGSDRSGVVSMQMNNSKSALIGRHNVIGRSIVIHKNEDDMGKAGTEGSKRSGNAGPYLACCVIVRTKQHGQWAENYEHPVQSNQVESSQGKAGKRMKKGRKHDKKHKGHGDHRGHGRHMD